MSRNRVPGTGDSGRGLAPSGVRQARIARVNMIRRRVVGGALTLFVTTWMLITLMLVSGHDPALASRSSTRTSASTATTTPSTTTPAGSSTTTTSTPAASSSTTTASSPATSSSTSGSSSSSSSGSGTGSSGVSSVTSSQS